MPLSDAAFRITNQSCRGMTPLVSFVIMARNDDYMGNACWRLEMTLEFLCRNLAALGRLHDAEIIIVDWQSDIPLHRALNMSNMVREITRFIVVPPDFSSSRDFACEFPRPVILNAGIRRSCGEYIVQTLGDVLWPLETLALVFEIASGGSSFGDHCGETLFVIGRKEIPYEFVSTSPSADDVETFLRECQNEITDIPPYPFLMVPGDSLMMHRNMWLASRGFDERLQHWGWSDCDLILRMRLKYGVAGKSDDDRLYVYHLNHIVPGTVDEVNSNRQMNPWLFNDVTVNDEAWGVGGELIPEAFGPPVQPAPGREPVYLPSFRLIHARNLFRFVLQEFSIKRLRFALSCMALISEQSPPGSIGRALQIFFRLIRPRGASQP